MRLLFEIFATVAFAGYVWKINKWVALFLMLSMISMLFPFYTRDSYLSFMAVFFAVTVYVVIIKTFDEDSIKYLLNAFCVIALINCVYLIIQYAGINYIFFSKYKETLSDIPTALMGNQNFASAVLAFCFPAFLRRKWCYFIPLILIGLIITQTTAGIVAIAAGLIVYSIASPRRIDPYSNLVYNSVLKPINQSYKDRTIDINTGKVSNVEISPATNEEIESTIKVMGGEDLQLWVDYLHDAQLLSENCKVISYSYIGPKMTYPIYRNGTIGQAKEHLEKTTQNINHFLKTKYNGSAFVSVNKALVTQASSAIPVVPLYISLLYKISH
jgi:hypothetical protein